MRQIMRLYPSSLQKTTPLGGFPLLRPLPSLRRLVSMRLGLTNTECCTLLAMKQTRRIPWRDGEAAMDRLRLVEEAGAAQDVAERNMTAEWAALTTGSAIRKTIQVGVPTLAPQMSHHGSHSNDNGVFCNDHYRQRTK